MADLRAKAYGLAALIFAADRITKMIVEARVSAIDTIHVIPGFFDTPMTRETLPAANKEFWIKYCPAGRIGELDEIAKVVTFLASDGGGFINGQAIPVTGGLDWVV